MPELFEPNESDDQPAGEGPGGETEGPGIPTYTVVMLGGPRAGKTSVLARMYEDANDTINDAGLRLQVSSKITKNLLESASRALNTMGESVLRAEKEDNDALLEDYGVIANEPGELRVHDFEIMRRTKTYPVGRIRFVDLSGEDLAKTSLITHEWTEAADMFLVCINTPAMMAAVDDADYRPVHSHRNGGDITDLLSTRANAGRAPDVVLFAPIKSERWLAEDSDGLELIAGVEKMYASSIDLLNGGAFESTSVAITPVVTVGNVHFAGYRPSPEYDQRLGLTGKSVLETWRLPDGKGATPAYYSEPFRWALHGFVRRIDYAHLALAMGDRGSFIEDTGHVLAGIWRDFVSSVREIPGVGRFVDESDLEIDAIKSWVEDTTGLSDFKKATDDLYAGRSRDLPFKIIREVD